MQLRDYMHHNRINAKQLADQVGVSHSYMRALKNSAHYPSERLAKKIEIVTGGLVTIEDLRGKK
jgi:DNA-binding transcriptional regulator YdaS (Cro superfamily)